MILAPAIREGHVPRTPIPEGDAPASSGLGRAGPPVRPGAYRYCGAIADEFDPHAMIERFRARARAVRQRGVPPLEGPERKRFVDQARIDFQDYAMIGDADTRLEGGILTLIIDLRPAPIEPPGPSGA